MAVENFTTYTETDPNSKITVAATKVTFANMSEDADIHVYKDKGEGFFSGDFTINLTVSRTTDQGGDVVLCTLANLVDDALAIKGVSGDYLGILMEAMDLRLYEVDGGSSHSSSTYNITKDTVYYLTFSRDETVGTYGTLYLYIYSDSGRTTLLSTLTITLHSSKKDFRYLYAVQSTGSTNPADNHGYIENLDLVLVYTVYVTASPSVTVQAATSVDKTTATGNGDVTSLGTPEATQYGSVWATHSLPTISDNKTEDVASPPATGAFTSSLTGLAPNTLYYYRTYIYYDDEQIFYSPTTGTFTTLSDVPVLGTDLTLLTHLATEVATTTAVGNGTIDNNGGSAITQHGVCWVDDATYNGGAHPPTTADSKTQEGATTTIGDFQSLMTGLTAGTLFYFKAYAVNSDGTGYGNEVTFTTLIAGAPVVVTRTTINVRATTATGVGNILSLGGAPVTQHGHCWKTKAAFDADNLSPTTSDSKKENGTGAVGAFSSDITVLADGTTYYVRAFATNSYGTAYGNNDVIYPTSVWGTTRGHYSILGEHFVYTSRSGTQRGLLGVEF